MLLQRISLGFLHFLNRNAHKTNLFKKLKVLKLISLMVNISIKLYQKLLQIGSFSQQPYIQIIPESLTSTTFTTNTTFYDTEIYRR